MNELSKYATAMITALAFLVGGGAADLSDGHFDGPSALVPSSSHGPCPGGWKYEGDTINDTVIRRCVRDPWIVVLDPDGKFDYGLDTSDEAGVKIDDSSQVPQWPTN